MNNNKKRPKGFIPAHGGYRKLMSYQKAEIIYDGTVYFTKRFFKKFDRTIDQMVQAARSGKQNIAEGSMASATSKEMEIKLTNVAKASLEELMIDYEDFLRTNKLVRWEKSHSLMMRFREMNRTRDANYETFKDDIENESPEVCANTMACLIHVTTYLLSQQIKILEKKFIDEGGLRERMAKVRIEKKKGN